MGKEAPGFIYVIHAEGTNYIKVGFTRDIEERLAGLQSASAHTLAVLASWPGSIAEERRIHQKLAPHRRHGEWFDAFHLINVEEWQGLEPTPRRPPKQKPRKVYTGEYRNPHGLPTVEGIQWEKNSSGGREAWHVPPGVTHRKDKTYLGYVGKRLITTWQSLAPQARRRAAEDWIAQKRREKGINP